METLTQVLVATAMTLALGLVARGCVGAQRAVLGGAPAIARHGPDHARVRLPDPGRRVLRPDPVHGHRGRAHLRGPAGHPARRSRDPDGPGRRSSRRRRPRARRRASCSGRSSCRWPGRRSSSPRTRASSSSWRWSSSAGWWAPAGSATTSSAGFARRDFFGEGLAAGIAIVLLGIMLDRITQGAGERPRPDARTRVGAGRSSAGRRRTRLAMGSMIGNVRRRASSDGGQEEDKSRR